MVILFFGRDFLSTLGLLSPTPLENLFSPLFRRVCTSTIFSFFLLPKCGVERVL